MRSIIIYLSFLALTQSRFAHEKSSKIDKKEVEDREVETITVEGKRLRALRERNDSLNRQTETLSGEALRQFGAHSLADAISQASGVNTQTFCANCGAKRITIDGLRGEHTTILIDGFPMHSTISAFYGVDAIPVVGVAGVEISRGPGFALLAPEAIGGTINLLTVNPLKNSLQVYSEGGSHGSYQSSVLGTAKKDGTGVAVSGQQGALESWDIDHNGIGESPYRKTQAGSVKITQKLGEAADLSLRHSESDLLIIGGNTKHFAPSSFTRIQAQPSDFLENNVTKSYIGDISRITDVIRLKRAETAFLASHDLNDETIARLRLSQVDQYQDANYSHGYDYRNHDHIDYANLEIQHAIGNHVLTLGLDGRKQSMNSQSDALYVQRQNPLIPDSLKFQSTGISLLNEWTATEQLSFDLAMRIDSLHIEWIDLNRSVEETVYAPRVNGKYLHDDHISSRLSYGVGYRPPLTLFESEHGSDHDGFLVEIDKVEKAESWVYSLSANYPSWFITGTVHETRLKNMAYAFDKVLKGQSMIFRNSDEVYDIWATDIFVGGKLWDNLNLQASYEHFFYPDSYTEKLPAAGIEQRFIAEMDWELNRWDLGFQAIWIGERNLSRYGYHEYYKVYDLDVTSPSFGQVSQQKNQHAPAFWFANAHAKVPLTEVYSLAFRVNNVFDYTQTGTGDSPTTWHYHLNHAHFDNFHTWGPLAGREYFAGMEGRW